MKLIISSNQLTMLYFMAGLSISKLPEIYKKEFEDLMEQMNELLHTKFNKEGTDK